MSTKLLEATCLAGVVTAEGVPVPAAEVLSEGVAQSSGVLLIEGDKAKYLVSNASDIKDLLTQINAALDTVAGAISTVAGALTAINAAIPTAVPSASTPFDTASLLADLSSIEARIATLNLIKDALK